VKQLNSFTVVLGLLIAKGLALTVGDTWVITKEGWCLHALWFTSKSVYNTAKTRFLKLVAAKIFVYALVVEKDLHDLTRNDGNT